MLISKGAQERGFEISVRAFIGILISLIIFSQAVSAISVVPTYVDAGALEHGDAYVFSYEIINRLSSSVPANIDFQLTESSKYLEENIIFFPSNLDIDPDESHIYFSVLIVGTENITEGDHLILFRPVPIPIEQAEANASHDMTVASHILQTTVVGINFSISSPGEVIIPTYSPSGGSSSVLQIISDTIYDVEIVDETKNIMITVPWFFRAAQKNETLSIKIKNVGASNFTDLVLDITGTPEFDIVYDTHINSLFSGEERIVDVNMSGFSNTYHFLNIVVSDDDGQKWENNVIVYVPEEPRKAISYDCVVFEPKNVTIAKGTQTYVNLSILNTCNISLHNINVMIDGLNHLEHIGTLEPHKAQMFDIVMTVFEDKDYPILFIYDEGKTSGRIHVAVKEDLRDIYFIICLFFVLFLVYIHRLNILKFLKSKDLFKHRFFMKKKRQKEEFTSPLQAGPIFRFENNRFLGLVKKDKKKNDA
ncbi:MAG: hypothetical protein GQ477_01765 [Nanohaloarchaea archaeon]|nr:hypothetical protein [Candidatus Nanohaloarchaea archaeon]